MNPMTATHMDDVEEGNEAPRTTRRSRRLRRHMRALNGEELNIVSMIDVFAVLVFFLLVSSSIAAAKLNILSLNLPSTQQSSVQEKKTHVTVSILKDALVISDRGGNVRRLKNTPQGYNLPGLSELLLKTKRAAPQDGNLILLVDPQVAYEYVVAVMDAVRFAPVTAIGKGQPREMYPLISIGETGGGGGS